MDYWDLCFIQLVAWRLHPGVKPGTAPTLEEIANMVDALVDVRNRRNSACQHGPQQQQQE